MEGPQLLDYAAKQQGYNTFDEYIEGHLRRGEGAPVTPATERRLDEDLRKVDQNMIQKMSFWYDPDDPECSTEEHDEFDENDITEMAHAKLEEIREMRHYQRLAVWELPLLSSKTSLARIAACLPIANNCNNVELAKPFELPSEKQVLRWRYTTYMGDNHPAEKKVVVQFAPDDLGLTPVQADKLKKLAGPRYNPEKELIKMSCESYPHPAQNKRYLSALVDDLIAAAKDPKDNFADIPLDTRHHRVQAKPRFPKEWFMTEERKLELEEGRRQLRQQEIHAIESGQVVDGKRVIESYLVKKAEEEANKQKVEQLVPAGRPGKSSPSARAR